jgi:hypothetical protein
MSIRPMTDKERRQQDRLGRKLSRKIKRGGVVFKGGPKPDRRAKRKQRIADRIKKRTDRKANRKEAREGRRTNRKEGHKNTSLLPNTPGYSYLRGSSDDPNERNRTKKPGTSKPMKLHYNCKGKTSACRSGPDPKK